MSSSAAIVCWTTASNLPEARRISSALLDQKLAACISISAPVESHYVWKGKKEKSREYLLMIKTRRSFFRKVEQAILKEHSYECPEIIALPVSAGSRSYLKWLNDSLKR